MHRDVLKISKRIHCNLRAVLPILLTALEFLLILQDIKRFLLLT